MLRGFRSFLRSQKRRNNMTLHRKSPVCPQQLSTSPTWQITLGATWTLTGVHSRHTFYLGGIG